MAGRIRILLVVDNLDVGGVREVVLSQARGLAPATFDLGLLTLADDLHRLGDGDLPEGVARFGVVYRDEYGYGLLDYLADGVLLRAARRQGGEALDRIRAFGPDILHFHTLPRNLGLGILAARRSDLRLVFTDHVVRIHPGELAPHSRAVLRFAYRRLYRHYHVISVGPVVEASVRASGWLHPRRRNLTLPNQIDLGTFHPPREPRPDEPLTIVMVARIQQVKGHDVLIRAFAKLPTARPVRLILVGPDAMGGAMQRLAAEVVPRPHEVVFLGARSDVADLLRSASIGVLPSRREGLPLALLEMMASALPVVVSDVPELRDLVDDGQDGLVVPVEDVDALSVALARLVEDRALRRRLGAAARARAERHMEADGLGRLQAFYEEVYARG